VASPIGLAPRRTDARQNRDRVVAAAAGLFAERGLATSVEQVAARAGVGKATVYRSFPTKEHLVAAVAIERLDALRELALQAAGGADPWVAFQELVEAIAEVRARDRIVLDALELSGHVEELQAARAATTAAIAALMDLAKAQGRLRADATLADLRVLLGGLNRARDREGLEDPRAWRRYGRLVANALRAE
jgi:AcrR family transcriptional regulator